MNPDRIWAGQSHQVAQLDLDFMHVQVLPSVSVMESLELAEILQQLQVGQFSCMTRFTLSGVIGDSSVSAGLLVISLRWSDKLEHQEYMSYNHSPHCNCRRHPV